MLHVLYSLQYAWRGWKWKEMGQESGDKEVYKGWGRKSVRQSPRLDSQRNKTMRLTFDNAVSHSKIKGYNVWDDNDADSDDEQQKDAPLPSPLSSRHSLLSTPLFAPSIDNNTTIDSIFCNDSGNGWTLVGSKNERGFTTTRLLRLRSSRCRPTARRRTTASRTRTSRARPSSSSCSRS